MTDENRNQPEGDEVRDDMAAAGAADASAAGRGEANAEPSPANVETPAAESTTESDADDLPTISEDDLRDLLNEAMAPPAAEEDEPADAAAPESEHLEDLRRVTAEYANYRRRTEREKAELRSHATASVVKQLLPVVDDLGRAKQAGDLEDGSAMRVIADKLLGIIERMGVEPYGAVGETFDPTIHEAIAQLPNPEVEAETIADVVELGYRIGEIELRPAKVAVFVPAS
ncbi:nucleotide exchange factor GrpE [uncultured Gulosibacter sp.]|uniref:nucleotide exchange factor GrpE n=1 Tax=uncultured Gulosibacter sp. TaxID=1339167 RepID=UPI00288B0583|nr:nucleotide exchange factor GrpE [uncultured Gulosibacter sp.]